LSASVGLAISISTSSCSRAGALSHGGRSRWRGVSARGGAWHHGNLMKALLAAMGLGLAAASARSGQVRGPEHRIFRMVNQTSDVFTGPARVIMPAGSVPAIGAAGLLVGVVCGPREAVSAAAAGASAWGAVRVLKPFVGRGRPAQLLPDVRRRGPVPHSLGFPSSHAAVSFGLGLSVPGTGRAHLAGVVAAGLVATGRVYVGAHLPLDVVGGAAVGYLSAAGIKRFVR